MMEFLTGVFNLPSEDIKAIEAAILSRTGFRPFYDFTDRVKRFMYTHGQDASNTEGYVALAWKKNKLSGFLSVVVAKSRETLVDLLSSPSFFAQTHDNPKEQINGLLSRVEECGIDLSAPYETDPEAIMVTEKGTAVWPAVLLMGRYAAMKEGCNFEIAHSLETGVYKKEPAMIHSERTKPHTGSPLIFGVIDLHQSHQFSTINIEKKLNNIF